MLHADDRGGMHAGVRGDRAHMLPAGSQVGHDSGRRTGWVRGYGGLQRHVQHLDVLRLPDHDGVGGCPGTRVHHLQHASCRTLDCYCTAQ